MSNIFSRIGKSKNPDSVRYKYEMAERMKGHHIKYVTEKRDGVDEVIGKSGGLNIKDDEFIVFASEKILFRCKIPSMRAWELMSHDGVVITAHDLETDTERTIIVHYVYYR